MNFSLSLRLATVAAALIAAPGVRADSFTSSASSAGSASSGSVSDSLSGSSKSSGGDEKTAAGNYRVVQVAAADRPGVARLTLAAETGDRQLVLDLPQAIVAQQGITRGHAVLAQNRVYGIEFAHTATKQAFYLVLADEWHGELAPRLVGV